MKFTEAAVLFLSFFRLVLDNDYGKTTSMDEFMDNNSFTEASRDYVNRLCRLTDGAGSDRYTLWEFLQLANQQFFYHLAQPKLPNDKGLFVIWKKALEKIGVSVMLNTKVTELRSENGKMKSITTDKGQIEADKYILCIPPNAMERLVVDSPSIPRDVFGVDITTWSSDNSYINDVPVIFHWRDRIDLPTVWGFPKSDWGVAFVVLSDYMDFDDTRSLTVISSCITLTDNKSSVTRKTANETSSTDDLVKEVFRQISISFPGLGYPDYAILSPTVSRVGDAWVDSNSAYVATYKNSPISPFGKIENLYNVGMQNGKSTYAFTSMEGAVTNALDFSHRIEEDSRRFKIRGIRTAAHLIKLVIVVLLVALIIVFVM